jgi:hypothetical protein
VIALPPPGLLAIAALGLFWTMASGIAMPHPFGKLPLVAVGSIVGAGLGDLIAQSADLTLGRVGDVQVAGGSIGALVAIAIVRRILA